MQHVRHVRVLQGRSPPINVLSTHSAWLMSSLVSGCAGLLSGAAMSGNRLRLEVTESALMEKGQSSNMPAQLMELDVRLQLEADELHFSRAADRRGVAQSAVSIQIQQMEEDLGVGSVLVAANPVSNRRMRRAHQEQARARLLAAFFNAAAGSPSGAR